MGTLGMAQEGESCSDKRSCHELKDRVLVSFVAVMCRCYFVIDVVIVLSK
jgi:hypothetical protein